MKNDFTCKKCNGTGRYIELLSHPQEIYLIAERYPNATPHMVEKECFERKAP